MSDEPPCRIDVWLWRARFFKSRSLAGRFVEEGRVRLHRGGTEVRLDKPSRAVRQGDGLVFALGGRLVSVRVRAIGARRGPAAEARALYSDLDAPPNASDGGRPGRADAEDGVDSPAPLP